MSQDRTQTNEDFTALATAALAKATAEARDEARERQIAVTSRGTGNTSGYQQPGATDVSVSLGGVGSG